MSLVWGVNTLLLISILGINIGGMFLSGTSAGKTVSMQSEAFDGVMLPIAQVPNWAQGNADKKLRFSDIASSSLIALPVYDTNVLSSIPTTDTITNARYTFVTPYMGSYRGNYAEDDGSHLAIDIRAPLGTPVVSIANAVVSRVKTDPSGDGIYVVLKHDGVPMSDGNETVYSAYLHLEDATVELGQKIQKGTVIGHVGMTGITTTPHLHFQIDKPDAPFHPYWPFNGSDMKSASVGFFEAVNIGLGKDKAKQYSYHPMDFVYGKLFKSGSTQTLTSAPRTPVALSEDGIVVTKPPTAPTQPTNIPPTIVKETTVANNTTNLGGAFRDIEKDSSLSNAVAYLKDKGVVKGYDDGTFGVSRDVTRKESVLLISRLFAIYAGDQANYSFVDVSKDDDFHLMASRFVDLGILAKQDKFRPSDTVTKGELATMLVRASSLTPVVSPNFYTDVADTHTLRPYLNSYALQTNTSGNFQPSLVLSRSSTAEMLYGWAQRGKGGFALNLE